MRRYTAPELVSMWSSILNQEGVTLCAPYMLGMEETLMDCMRSRTVGSIVAILLISNLNGDQSGSIDAVVPLFSQVCCPLIELVLFGRQNVALLCLISQRHNCRPHRWNARLMLLSLAKTLPNGSGDLDLSRNVCQSFVGTPKFRTEWQMWKETISWKR